MSTKPRVPSGEPDGGRFTATSKDEAEIALEALIIDRDAFWAPGNIHSAGGYDNIVVDEGLGSTTYELAGEPHRDDGPAVILADGTEMWFCEGVHHRDDDLPAIVGSTGEREWYRYGSQHRDGDKPAVIYADGSAVYLQDGKLHRSGGEPAVVYQSGHTEWWVDGELHRPSEYGPARIRSNGKEEFWEQGKIVKGARS
jgi:hypothetical protein